jgi:hypothetical protein
VSFSVPSGSHRYSADFRHPNKNSYYDYAPFVASILATTGEGKIEQVDCAQAKQEAKDLKPIETKKVSVDMRSQLSTSSF